MRLPALLLTLCALPSGATPVLELSASARSVAMGGTMGAGTDASALDHNPAMLADLPGRSVVFSHGEFFSDVTFDALAVGRRWSGGTAAAIGYRRLGYGEFARVDNEGRPVSGALEPRDLVVTLGGARRLGAFSAGASVKRVMAELNSVATTVAADAGLLLTGGPWNHSLVLRNAGPGLRYRSREERLPTELRAGSAWSSGGGALAVEVSFPREGGPRAGLGGEFLLGAAFETRLLLRGGLDTRAAREALGTTAGLAFGIGVAKGGLRFDYGVADFGTLGYTHRMTAGYLW